MEQEKKTQAPPREQVLREYSPIGKYRVRLMQNPRKKSGAPVLDIREYVDSATFQGFTKRGIRLADRGEIDLLRDVLKDVLERNGFEKPAPGTLPFER